MNQSLNMSGPDSINPTESNTLNDETVIRAEFSRPVPPEYQELIGLMKFAGAPSQLYSNALSRDVVRNYKGFHDEFGIDPDEFLGTAEKFGLTQRGELWKSVIQGRDFIDLGCGQIGYSMAPRLFAQLAGAKRYIGIDAYLEKIHDESFVREEENISIKQAGVGYCLLDKLGAVKVSKENEFTSVWVQDEILGFVSKIKEGGGKVFYMAGIEPREGWLNIEEPTTKTIQQYAEALVKEFNRVTIAGDAVILCNVGITLDLDPELIKCGFEKIEPGENDPSNLRDSFPGHRIYVKQ